MTKMNSFGSEQVDVRRNIQRVLRYVEIWTLPVRGADVFDFYRLGERIGERRADFS